jgi:signal peptidase I
MTDAFRWQRGYLTNTAAAADVSVGMPPIYRPSRDNWGPIVVPPAHFFVLGDNRDNSLDSRYWGFVPDSLLRGTPWIVYYSFTPDSLARAPWLTRIRWGRLGSSVR